VAEDNPLGASYKICLVGPRRCLVMHGAERSIRGDIVPTCNAVLDPFCGTGLAARTRNSDVNVNVF
jgi:hypothetical protein